MLSAQSGGNLRSCRGTVSLRRLNVPLSKWSGRTPTGGLRSLPRLSKRYGGGRNEPERHRRSPSMSVASADPALPNQQRVTDAIKHWEQNTPIRFVKYDAANPDQADFVVFRSGNGCASSVGRQ
jgi:hypothetical protein